MSTSGSLKADPAATVVVRRFVDCDQLGESLRGGTGEYTQIGVGDCKGSLTRIDLDGLILLVTDISNRTLFQGGSDTAHRVISIPLRWSGRLRLNGIPFERPRPVFWHSGREFSRVGDDVRMASLIFEVEALDRRIAAWTGNAPDRWDFSADKMLPDTPATRRFISAIGGLSDDWMRRPEQIPLPGATDETIDRLFNSFALAVESGVGRRTIRGETPLKRNSIVRAVTDYLHTHPDLPITLLDLCHLTGRSARTVEHAFQSVMQLTPMRYVKLFRLGRARALLRKSSAAEMNVSQCAYAAGFSHLGRFSVEYRKMFGEHPSKTLRHVRSSAPGGAKCG